jgi:hypothetical protein
MADGQELTLFEKVAAQLQSKRDAGQVTYITDKWEYEIPTDEEVKEAVEAVRVACLLAASTKSTWWSRLFNGSPT